MHDTSQGSTSTHCKRPANAQNEYTVVYTNTFRQFVLQCLIFDVDHFEIKRQHYFNRTSFLCQHCRGVGGDSRLLCVAVCTASRTQQRVGGGKALGYFYTPSRNGLIIISHCRTRNHAPGWPAAFILLIWADKAPNALHSGPTDTTFQHLG